MSNRLLSLLLTALLGVSASPVWAQQANPSFTLDQAIGTAIQNNPQLKAAQARLGVSEAQIITAGARLNPSILSDNGIAEKTYRLGIEQTLELGGKRKKRVAVAQAQQQAVMTEINTVLLDLRTNVRRTYTRLYNAQEREKAYQDIVKTTERLLGVAQSREQAGDIARVDVLGARIAVTNTRNDLQSASYQVIEARNGLNALLNQPINASAQLIPPSPFSQADLIKLPKPEQGAPLQGAVTEATANLEALIQEALTNRPELQQTVRGFEVAQRQLELARSNRIPNLRLAAGPDMVFGDGSAFNAFVTGNLDLPVFNRQQGPIQEALAQQKQLSLEQDAVKNRITYEVINAHTAFIANQERIKRYETELLPDAEQIVKLAQLSFQEGKASILTPINAQQAYINTRLGYLQALTDYQNAISDLERAVGTGL